MLSNGGLPTGDQRVGDAFMAWLDFSQNAEQFPIGGIIDGGCTSTLSPEVIAAYDAPFPEEAHKEAARQMPSLVPITPDSEAAADNRRAWGCCGGGRSRSCWRSVTRTRSPEVQTDPFLKLVPGTEGLPHTTIEGAGHFVQEDAGAELARIVIDLIERTP